MSRNSKRILNEYLVASARAGDKSAFDHLARDWHRKLTGHAYRLCGDVDMAQEAAQEGWVDIARNISALKDTAVFPSWAFRIVTRRVADNIRKQQRKRRIEAGYALEPQPQSLSSRDMQEAGENTEMRNAIAQLSAPHRVVIALFYTEELSVTEISVALEVPAGTVKTRLMHARKKLRTVLEGEQNE